VVKDEPKLSRFEILGAWLNVWTPPRGARVPPIPWRTIRIGALVAVVVLGAAAAVIVPAIDESKDERAARDARELAQRQAARNERLRIEQQPRFGDLAAGDSRTEQLVTIETAIGRDARERFNPRARAALCELAAGEQAAADRVAYNCLSGVRDIVGAGEQKGAQGTLGIPYRSIVDFRAHRYAFCKVNPPPGEQVIPDPRKLVQLPKACME
jgi:type II secretory pathway pseudopilin PulG